MNIDYELVKTCVSGLRESCCIWLKSESSFCGLGRFTSYVWVKERVMCCNK